MKREYHKWYSERLHRDMELLIFGHGGRAVLLFPTRMARFYDYENWRIIEGLHHQIDNGELQIFCVDSVDAESFYNLWLHPADRMRRHLQYEQYILNEVVPLMYAKSNTGYLEVAGCSMGAYHAANIAFKNPLLFKRLIGMSGRYDINRPIWDFRDLLDGYHNQDIYFNMPRQYLANATDHNYLEAIRSMEIIFTIGETDPFLTDNREFSELLWSKGIPHQLYIWDNYAHRPRYWRQMVQLYL